MPVSSASVRLLRQQDTYQSGGEERRLTLDDCSALQAQQEMNTT